MNPPRAALIDESSDPPLRTVLGTLLARSRHADFAIRRIRLAGIDLSPAELGPLQTCRVLVGRLDAGALHDLPGNTAAPRRAALDRLLRFARSNRLAVRAAPTAGWNPDFSVLHGLQAAGTSPITACCLVGSHYFHEPDPPDGPAFTTLLTAPAAVAAVLRRFETLWTSGYDVLPAVTTALETLLLDNP